MIERYQKEILRVFGVLESVLSKQEWLVGGKCTIADLSFIMFVVLYPPITLCSPLSSWNHVAITGFVNDYKGFNLESDFPALARYD